MYFLYSPPSGDYPQELPDRWRFGDGTVRTDLQSLTNAELGALGWSGPVSYLTPRQLDEEGNDLVEPWDYDSNTHKAVWYKAERKFIVVELHIDDTPYMSGDHIKLNVGPSDWETFKKTALISPALNAYVSSVMLVAPLAAIALPATLLKIETDSFRDFENTWEAITSVVPIPEELKVQMIELARSCNLPLRFIDIISE
jgi:hypothetical protein